MSISESKERFKQFFKDLGWIQSHDPVLSCVKCGSRKAGFKFIPAK